MPPRETLTDNWYIPFQIYTGRHVAPNNRENLVEQVDCSWKGFRSKPMRLWRGGSNWNCKRGDWGSLQNSLLERDIQREVVSSKPSKNLEPWTKVFPKECIILHSTRRHLMAKYTSLRNADNIAWCPCQNRIKFPIYYCYYFSFEIVRRQRGSISMVRPRIFINTLKIEVKLNFSARTHSFLWNLAILTRSKLKWVFPE